MAHTPGPKLCPKCGERQPDTQDWLGEAIRLKVVNAELLAALTTAAPAFAALSRGETPLGLIGFARLADACDVAIAKATER